MQRKTKPLEDMTEDMRAENITKLYKGGSRPTYGEVSQELKAEAITAAVQQQQELLQAAFERGKIDLNDEKEVEAITLAYMESCKQNAIIPTLAGLACAMGVSRNRVYAFLRKSPNTESADIIDRFRSASAAIIAQASLSRTIDNSTSIFLLKNAGQQYSDKSEIELVAFPGSQSSDPYIAETVEPYLHARGVDYSRMNDDEKRQAYFEERYMKTGIIDAYANLED